MKKKLVTTALAALALSALPARPCDGKSVIKTNPATGNEERLCAVWDGHDYEIEWSEKTTGWSAPVRLTDNLDDDVAADIAFAADGTTGAVWRDSGSKRVFYRERVNESGAWNWRAGAAQVSDGVNDASAPRLSFDDVGTAWIGWHEYRPDGSVGVMSGIGDGQEPWPKTFDVSLVGMTVGGGNLELDMNVESGENWLVWIDSDDHLGYSQWNDVADVWGPILLEPYSGPSDVDDGKERVRQEVLP